MENKKENYIRCAKQDFENLIFFALEHKRTTYPLYQNYIDNAKKTLEKYKRHYLYEDMIKETENLFSIYVKMFFPEE